MQSFNEKNDYSDGQLPVGIFLLFIKNILVTDLDLINHEVNSFGVLLSFVGSRQAEKNCSISATENLTSKTSFINPC
jgi:hypothetical protein